MKRLHPLLASFLLFFNQDLIADSIFQKSNIILILIAAAALMDLDINGGEASTPVDSVIGLNSLYNILTTNHL